MSLGVPISKCVIFWNNGRPYFENPGGLNETLPHWLFAGVYDGDFVRRDQIKQNKAPIRFEVSTVCQVGFI